MSDYSPYTKHAVVVRGLSRLRRAMNAVDRGSGKTINRYLRTKAKEIRDDARTRTPKRSGRLRRSVKHSVTAKQMSLYSDSPYSAVHEYGGTIRPRGTRIRIEKSRMLTGAVEDNRDELEEYILDMMENLARENGFGT